LILTPKGEQMAKELYNIANKAITAVMEEIDPDELEAFFTTLEKVSKKFNQYVEQQGTTT
jgi:DNA-binding MarR family transcriptional regulator